MVEDEGPSSFSTCQRWIHGVVIVTFIVWDDDGGDEDVIDDYGEDEEFAWCTGWALVC